ncbi:multiple sugar transport system permease protein [Streptomyces achromogenes]|uniref:carbohydrate ABC transporter permease n=1 Tax=Streptomyces achromogenes TaxID=67255 RepID=UPI00277D2842|nr:carbohydrate ABC transporter permease [Streptomyces achromogenes]MDQ0835426.1 multiple sugar transport system permease protein [Streptomyces achromogenes]
MSTSVTASPAKSAAPGLRTPRKKHTPGKPKRNVLLTVLMALMVLYTVVPLIWLIINSTKTQAGLADSNGLWFAHDFALWDNVRDTFTYHDGIFGRWLLNTLLYVGLGAGGATLLAVLGGYALAKFQFPGRRAVFAVVIGAVAVPGTALAVPTFLMFSKMGLTDTPSAVIIPSLVSPFGLYLMWVFAAEAIPTELLEAARMDGASEVRTFFQVALPLLAPGIVTVLLFTTVATWNNYFLPLIMLKDPDWYPLTLGLSAWSSQAQTIGGDVIFNLVITGSLLTILPLIAAFLFLQKHWQSGLAAGSVKE